MTDAVMQLESRGRRRGSRRGVQRESAGPGGEVCARLNQEQHTGGYPGEGTGSRLGPARWRWTTLTLVRWTVRGEHFGGDAQRRRPRRTPRRWRGRVVVQVPPQAPGVPAPQGPVQGQTKDVDLVMVTGAIDLNKMCCGTWPTRIRKPVSAAFQRAVIYRIDAEQRQARMGGWGQWQPGRTSRPCRWTFNGTSCGIKTFSRRCNNIKTQLKLIAQPDYSRRRRWRSGGGEFCEFAAACSGVRAWWRAIAGSGPGSVGPRPAAPLPAGRFPDFGDDRRGYVPNPDFGGTGFQGGSPAAQRRRRPVALRFNSGSSMTTCSRARNTSTGCAGRYITRRIAGRTRCRILR